MENISLIVRKKIAETKKIAIEEILTESIIKDELGITSMEYIVLLTDIASLLGIDLMSFSESEIIKTKTVGDLERVLHTKILTIKED